MSLTTPQKVILTHVNDMQMRIQHATQGATDHGTQKLNLAMREMQKKAAMGLDVHQDMVRTHELLKIQERQAQNNRFAQPIQPNAGRFGANPARPGYHTGTSMPASNVPGHLAPALSHTQVNEFNHHFNKMAALTGHANYFHH